MLVTVCDQVMSYRSHFDRPLGRCHFKDIAAVAEIRCSKPGNYLMCIHKQTKETVF